MCLLPLHTFAKVVLQIAVTEKKIKMAKALTKPATTDGGINIKIFLI